MALSEKKLATNKVKAESPINLLNCFNVSISWYYWDQIPHNILSFFEVTSLLTIGNETTEVTIKGECTNDPMTKITKVTTPRYDLFKMSEIPVHFNTDNVNLPPLPLHSRITRIVMIHNRLEHELVAYKWKK